MKTPAQIARELMEKDRDLCIRDAYEKAYRIAHDADQQRITELETKFRDVADMYRADTALIIQLEMALHGALATYRESWAHPGTDKMPHKLPDPAWVVNARKALEGKK